VPHYSDVLPNGSTPGFGTLHVSAQLAQRTYSTNAVRDTTFGSCPQCWHGWIIARRIRCSVKSVGFAIEGPANHLSGLFGVSTHRPAGIAAIRVQRMLGVHPSSPVES
jgi:hypothetical protein